jgi:hypothetical protein
LILLLSLQRNKPIAQSNKAQEALIFIVIGVLLALTSEFAVAPRIVVRENLRLWHSVGTLMFAVQWVCASITLVMVNSVRASDKSVA